MDAYASVTDATIWLDAQAEAVVQKAAQVLREEIAARTLIDASVTQEGAPAGATIALGTVSRPGGVFRTCADMPAWDGDASPDAYRIRSRVQDDRVQVGILGRTPRATLFGAGCLLRRMRMSRDAWRVPAPLAVNAAPAYPLIGHQLGYRDKTNSYCAWDTAQFDQYIRELAIFGANAIEIIPPGTDDLDDSPHFPLPHQAMLREQSRICAAYGLDVWIWFPVMQDDYADPAQVAAERATWRQTLQGLPRLDAVFVPGGDPGHTPVSALLPLLAQLADLLAELHPAARIWISPQGFARDDLDRFLHFLAEESPDWVGGVVHGPWVNYSMSEFRAMVPARYPIRNYPDITHTLSSQFPVPDWDVAYALTIGREPVNPRPVDMEHCFRYSQPGAIGMLTYSEGCNDDVNKCLWSGLSWQDQPDVFPLLEEYARFFIAPDWANDFAHGLYALERNWRGPLAINAGVQTTLRQFQALERAASPFQLRNWRFQQALYRAYYDAYTRNRLLYETGLEVQALDCLRQAAVRGSRAAVRAAFQCWDRAVSEPTSQDLRTRVFQLAEALFNSVRMQLSVDLHRAQYETRGANLDAIDFPLNDRLWWREQLSAALRLPAEAERLARIEELLSRSDATPGGFHVDLVRPHDDVHLADRIPFAADPGRLAAPSRRFPYRKAPRALPLSWRGGLVTLGATPLRLRFDRLDPMAAYELRIAYAGLSRTKVRLHTEEGVEIHGWLASSQEPDFRRFDIPPDAIRDGQLHLVWRPEKTAGSAGVVCDISELALCKKRWAA